jgi:5'-nucleotidase
MKVRSRGGVFAAVTVGLAALLAFTPAAEAHKPPKPPKPRDPVSVQILGLNDFHGQLEKVDPLASSGGRIGSLTSGTCLLTTTTSPCVPAGGVEYLATHVENLRAENRNTFFVSAGDLIGATPLLSALFHDEPTIEAFNLMDLDYNGVGNHEFDEGVDELLRMQYGNRPGRGYRPERRDGCHPEDGCGDGTKFRGAEFGFLAANVAYEGSGKTIFPPYAIEDLPGGVEVAFIGMTLEGTPLIVSPEGIASVDFLDEAESVNALIPHLQRRGVEAFVVLLHEGGSVGSSLNPETINSCVNPTGALPPIVDAMDDAIDIVITGHTNWAVNCVIDGKIVTGAASQGRLITDIDAKIDRRSGDFTEILVNNRIVTQDVAPARRLTRLIADYNVVAASIAAVPVGSTVVPLPVPLNRTATAAGETTLGRLIADAQLASSVGAGAQIALMNPGGIRADLAEGTITYGAAFAVQPFSNIVVTKTMTGAQIEQVLEQQFVTSAGGTRTLILQVSDGFTYTWRSGAAGVPGDRIDPTTIMLDGAMLDLGATYRVTMNSFLASGGDDFPAFNLGTDPTTGADDLDALVAYLTANPGYVPVTANRIAVVTP